MKLNPVIRNKGGNRFCGPAVISAIAEITTDQAAAMLRVKFDRRQITGVSSLQLLSVLGDLGVASERLQTSAGTLAAWLKASAEVRTAGRVYLVLAGNHWQLISGRRYVCGRTTEIVNVTDDKVKRRCRVRTVWELTPKVGA